MKIILVYIGIALTGIRFVLIAIMMVIRDKRNYSRLTGPFAAVPEAEKKMVKIGALLAFLGFLNLVIIQK